MSKLEGARNTTPEILGCLSLPRDVNVNYGNDLAVLRRPSPNNTVLILKGEVGGPWKVALGDLAPRTFTVTAATDVVTATAHAYGAAGFVDGPFKLTTTGTLPAGLSLNTPYWLRVIDANSFFLYATEEAAIAGAGQVDITGAGTGTHTIGGLAVAAAGIDIANGLYAWPVDTGDGWSVFAAPARVTVIGTGATDVLCYGWT